jgi:EPS-associated MarR family transcriptional regulator
MVNERNRLAKQRQRDAHYQVIHILQKNPQLTQRELSQELGLSLGKLNYCLKALADKGWIKIRNFTQSKTKHRYVYLVTPQGIYEKAQMTKEFLNRKIKEYEALRLEIDVLKNEMMFSKVKKKL